MKKIILLALTAFVMVGCKYTKEEAEKNMSVDGYILKEIAKHFFELGMAASNKAQKGE